MYLQYIDEQTPIKTLPSSTSSSAERTEISLLQELVAVGGTRAYRHGRSPFLIRVRPKLASRIRCGEVAPVGKLSATHLLLLLVAGFEILVEVWTAHFMVHQLTSLQIVLMLCVNVVSCLVLLQP